MTKPWLGKVGAFFVNKLKEVVSVTFDTTSSFQAPIDDSDDDDTDDSGGICFIRTCT